MLYIPTLEGLIMTVADYHNQTLHPLDDYVIPEKYHAQQYIAIPLIEYYRMVMKYDMV